jgi:predicted secreted protein
MRDGSLRYGLTNGVGAAIVGVLALMIGVVFAPITSRTTSADQVVVAVTIRGLIAYLGLFVCLGLAYRAGGQTERQQVTWTQEPGDQGAEQVKRDPYAAALTGAIVMLCYWFVTTIYAYFFPSTPTPKGLKSNGLQTLEQHAIYGLILVLLGAGIASLGGRTAFTRRVMSRLVMTPKPAPLPALRVEVAPLLPAPEPGTAPSANSAAPEQQAEITNPSSTASE